MINYCRTQKRGWSHLYKKGVQPIKFNKKIKSEV